MDILTVIGFGWLVGAVISSITLKNITVSMSLIVIANIYFSLALYGGML